MHVIDPLLLKSALVYVAIWGVGFAGALLLIGRSDGRGWMQDLAQAVRAAMVPVVAVIILAVLSVLASYL